MALHSLQRRNSLDTLKPAKAISGVTLGHAYRMVSLWKLVSQVGQNKVKCVNQVSPSGMAHPVWVQRSTPLLKKVSRLSFRLAGLVTSKSLHWSSFLANTLSKNVFGPGIWHINRNEAYTCFNCCSCRL